MIETNEQIKECIRRLFEDACVQARRLPESDQDQILGLLVSTWDRVGEEPLSDARLERMITAIFNHGDDADVEPISATSPAPYSAYGQQASL